MLGEDEDVVDICFSNSNKPGITLPMLSSRSSSAREIAALLRHALGHLEGDELAKKVAAILDHGRETYGWKYPPSWKTNPDGFLGHLDEICIHMAEFYDEGEEPTGSASGRRRRRRRRRRRPPQWTRIEAEAIARCARR